MIQAWLPNKALIFNPAAWSLSVELLFYISFPLIFNYMKNWQLKNIIKIILILWIVSQIVFHFLLTYSPLNDLIVKEGLFYKFHPLLHLNEFLVGIGFGYFFTQKLSDKSRNTDLYLIVIMFFLILILKYNNIINLHNGALSLIFGVFIILLSINNGLITKMFKKPLFVFLGEISYGVYIFAISSLFIN